jgi:hypothetical protein
VGALTGLPVHVASRPGLLAAARALAAGHRVVALDVEDGIGRLRVAVPAGDGVSAGRVALVVATMVGLRQRFPGAGLATVTCAARLQAGHRAAGWTWGGTRAITLASSVVARDPADVSDREPVQAPRRRPGAMGRAPWPVVVVAHEAWHRIEYGLEADRPHDALALRRDVGALLGLPSVERAFGRGPGAAEALARVAAVLGPYAATKPAECTAELFAAWWVGDRDPLVLGFGAVVDRLLPPV